MLRSMAAARLARRRARGFLVILKVMTLLLGAGLALLLGGCGGSDPGGGFGEGGVPEVPVLPPLLTDQVVIAHRGASGHAPEHTFAAYDLALDMGADYLEIDLVMTADGELVVLHDAQLERTARGPAEDCSGLAASKTLAQLRNCDFGSWFNERYPDRARPEFEGLPVPTLDEVFARYGQAARYYIEIKPSLSVSGGIETAVLDRIHAHGLYDGMVAERRIILQAFLPNTLLTLWLIDPRLPLVQLMAGGSQLLVAPAALYSFGIGPPADEVTPALIATARALGLAIHPYTVNRESALEEMAGRCVDGLFTDYPDRYRRLLETRDFGCAPALR